MKGLFLNLFCLLVLFLFSVVTFAGEEQPCPEGAGSGSTGGSVSTPPSGGGEGGGAGSGSTMEQMGRGFEPKEGGGKKPNLLTTQTRDPYVTLGTNPLNHKIVNDFLKYVDLKIYLKKTELKAMQQEQRNQLIKAKERVQIDKDYVDLRLKQWVDSWQKVDAAKKNIETKVKELGEINEKLLEHQDRGTASGITYEKSRQMEQRRIQLQMEMMDAVQQEEHAKNQEKAAGDSLQHSMQSLKRDTQQFEQMKNNMQATRNDTRSVPPPGR